MHVAYTYLYYYVAKISVIFAAFAPTDQSSCDAAKNSTFFGLPKWYKYLPYKYDGNFQDCVIDIDFSSNPEKAVLIGFAAIEILLRVGGVIAVGFVIWGGIQYVVSQGDPDAAARAKNTITNALIGLAIVMVASPLIAFLGNRIG